MKVILEYSDDYRSGMDIQVRIDNTSDETSVESNESHEHDILAEVTLEWSDKYTVHLVCGDGMSGDSVFKIIELDEKEEAQKVLNHLYSEVNEC